MAYLCGFQHRVTTWVTTRPFFCTFSKRSKQDLATLFFAYFSIKIVIVDDSCLTQKSSQKIKITSLLYKQKKTPPPHHHDAMKEPFKYDKPVGEVSGLSSALPYRQGKEGKENYARRSFPDFKSWSSLSFCAAVPVYLSILFAEAIDLRCFIEVSISPTAFKASTNDALLLKYCG